MTCILAALTRRGSLVVADTCISLPNMRALDSGKLVRRGAAIMGAAGDARLCETALFTRCKDYATGDLGKWLRTVYVPALWRAVGARVTEDLSVIIIAATATQIAAVDGGGAVNWPLDDYLAIGSGAEYAMGWMGATEGSGQTLRDRMQGAVDYAAKYAPGVAPPWTWAEAPK